MAVIERQDLGGLCMNRGCVPFGHMMVASDILGSLSLGKEMGLTGKAAKAAGYEVVEGSAPLSMNPFGMIISQTDGMIEVVADKKYGEVLGIHFIGQGACEMAGQAVLAIQMEATLEELTRAAFPHPTLSESVAEAARECLGRPIYLP